jgi:hypothetical protein
LLRDSFDHFVVKNDERGHSHCRSFLPSPLFQSFDQQSVGDAQWDWWFLSFNLRDEKARQSNQR